MMSGTDVIKIFIVAFIGFVVYSCSPQSTYKTLSVFFDGVPNPDEKDSISAAQTEATYDSTTIRSVRPKESEYTYHPPYREKDCDLCHNESMMGRLLMPMPALCYQCHENFNDQYKVLHGPVAAGYCTECHNPHFAKDNHLLSREGRELCLYCHEERDILKNEAHSGTEDMSCTECHNPHGGDDQYIFY